MAVPPSTFTWILLPPHGAGFGASDEFVVEGFRVRLMGNSLDLVFEGSGACPPDAARILAERYVQALGRRLPEGMFTLITTEEFLARTTPPFGGMITRVSPSQPERSRVARAVREARNELLASADQALRRCYDYLQDAHEHANSPTEEAAYAAYKAMEVMIERFGSSKKAVAALGKTVAEAKKVANDARHIRRKGQPPPRGDASARSVELARQAIRSYERYLLSRQ